MSYDYTEAEKNQLVKDSKAIADELKKKEEGADAYLIAPDGEIFHFKKIGKDVCMKLNMSPKGKEKQPN